MTGSERAEETAGGTRGVGAATTRIGNDVVDLRDPRCARKAEDDRFLNRVFDEAEASAIRSAPDPTRSLWIHWAAKEAAFKVVAKLLSEPPAFRHASFRFRPLDLAVQEEGGDAAGPDARGPIHLSDPASVSPLAPTGRVEYDETHVAIRIEAAPDRIHALAWHVGNGAPPAEVHRRVRLVPGLSDEPYPRWKDLMRGRLSERESRSVHRPASALVRLKARTDLARITGLDEAALEIVCDEGPPGRMPPRVVHRGEDHPADVSLSHHGRFVAWAFAVPESRP